jgi:hypothetical protein
MADSTFNDQPPQTALDDLRARLDAGEEVRFSLRSDLDAA